jgi:hypothetical protein
MPKIFWLLARGQRRVIRDLSPLGMISRFLMVSDRTMLSCVPAMIAASQ